MLRLVTNFTFAAGERRIVDLEGHAHGRLVDGQRRQRLDVLRVAQGIGDEQLLHAADADDVAGFRLRPPRRAAGRGGP